MIKSTLFSKVIGTRKTLERMESRIDKYISELDERVQYNTDAIEDIYTLVITAITKKKQD
jgi:effector-binding domain-containing protein